MFIQCLLSAAAATASWDLLVDSVLVIINF